jgi:hypothetical protein
MAECINCGALCRNGGSLCPECVESHPLGASYAQSLVGDFEFVSNLDRQIQGGGDWTMVQTGLTFSDTSAGAAEAPAINPLPAESGGGIFDRAVLLSVSFSSLGTKKKVDTGAVDAEGTDKDFLHLSKDILQSPILDYLKKFDGEIRSWIKARALPSMFKSGTYLWPIALVLDADNFLRARIVLRRDIVERFLVMYSATVADARERLGPMYVSSDYPSSDVVRAAFGLEYEFFEIRTPGALSSISAEIYRQEIEKGQVRVQAMVDACGELLYSEVLGLVDHMVKQLQPGEDGKKRRYHDSLVTNFETFNRLFDFRNLSGNSDLAAVVSQCKALMQGVTIDDVRTSDTLRERLAEGFSGIKAGLDSLIVNPGRRVNVNAPVAASGTDSWGDI